MKDFIILIAGTGARSSHDVQTIRFGFMFGMFISRPRLVLISDANSNARRDLCRSPLERS
jgi:hypothetical protein